LVAIESSAANLLSGGRCGQIGLRMGGGERLVLPPVSELLDVEMPIDLSIKLSRCCEHADVGSPPSERPPKLE
jgi:hypothetical protein